MSVKRMEKAALKERGAEIDLKIARTEEMRLEEMQMLTESWEEDLVVHTDPTAMRVAGSLGQIQSPVPSVASLFWLPGLPCTALNLQSTESHPHGMALELPPLPSLSLTLPNPPLSAP